MLLRFWIAPSNMSTFHAYLIPTYITERVSSVAGSTAAVDFPDLPGLVERALTAAQGRADSATFCGASMRCCHCGYARRSRVATV